jgi:hypothetical protein
MCDYDLDTFGTKEITQVIGKSGMESECYIVAVYPSYSSDIEGYIKLVGKDALACRKYALKFCYTPGVGGSDLQS